MINKIQVGDTLHDIKDTSIPDDVREISKEQISQWNGGDITISATEPENKTKMWIQKSRNMTDFSTWENGKVTTSGTFITSSSNGDKRSPFIAVKPNTTYTFSVTHTGTWEDSMSLGISQYINGANHLGTSFVNDKSFTFTTRSDCYYVICSISNLDTVQSVQLEKGPVSTEHEPYMTTTSIRLLEGDDTYTEDIIDTKINGAIGGAY